MISVLRCLSSSHRSRWAAVVSALVVVTAATIVRPLHMEAASLTVSWQAPTTNVDGTPLTDLAGYRIYVSTSTPACGGPSVVEVISPLPAPSEGQRLTYQVSGLALGTTYAVAVSAVDHAELESDCSPEVIGATRAVVAATPSRVDFGATDVGTSLDRSFTVQNTGSANLSGTAVVAAPFTIVSGASYAIAPGATQDVVVRFSPTIDGTFSGNINFTAEGDTISRVVTAAAMLPSDPPTSGTPSLTVTYDGKLRDRVGPGSVGRGADGSLDGTLTATLSATGGRTVTRLQLQSSAPGTWDTDGVTSAWLLGAATTLDGVLLNDPGTMAVNFPVADGGSFRLFAADWADIEFTPGTVLRVTATFSDGTTATAITFATAVVPTEPPSLALSYDGKPRDRVGQGNLSLGADGTLDGTLTATLRAPGGRTITRLQLQSSAPGTWDTDGATSAFALGVAATLDSALLNNPGTMAVNFAVADGGSFQVFAADFAGVAFAPGLTLTLTATFSDGTTVTAVTIAASAPPSVRLNYDGKLRDRVRAGNIGLGPDGVPDATFTVIISELRGRSITRLQLQSSARGTWDTDVETSAWVLGVAITLDGSLLNDPATMTVNFTAADGGSVKLFAADYADIEFVPGTTLTLTATFSDATTATTVTVASAVATTDPPSLVFNYIGKLRDHVGPGSIGLGADGALDGTLTATLRAEGGRTITRLQLQSSAPGTWDTDSVTSAWVLGVATTLDGTLLNHPGTMAVNLVVDDGGTFYLFAADFAGIEFVAGTTLTLTATFSDGRTLTAVTVVGPSLTLTYNGKFRDRVGPGSTGLGPDGTLDGTLTATLSATGGRTIKGLKLQSSAPGTWDSDGETAAWVLGVARSVDGPLLNDPVTMAVNFAVADGGSFQLFAADFANIEFMPGVRLDLTATFSDGTTATAVTVATAVVPTHPPALALSYEGKLRDRVRPGSFGLGADGALDGTLTATLSALGGRTVTRLQLQSSAPGTWDTDGETAAWVLGVARSIDDPLLNDPGTMTVNFAVPDGGSFQLFAADFADIEFRAGVTLNLTATFSDGSSATAIVTAP